MFLNINHNIGNFVNNALLYLQNKSITEKSTKELEATTAELNLSLIEDIEQDTAITEEQDLNNSDIQRDLKEEFLRVVQYSSYSEASYAEFIEKFLDNPKFQSVLTKRVERQDLSEIEAMLLSSIMEHLELLGRLNSSGNSFCRFLADPLNEQYFPEIEDFDTEQEYLQCVQEVQKEKALSK